MWRNIKVYREGPAENRRDHKARRVCQYDRAGNLLKVWPSAKIAAGRLGISPTSITHVCRGTNPTARGFKWQYADIAPAGRIEV